MQTRGENTITKYGLSRTNLLKILPSTLTSLERLNTLLVCHESSVFSCVRKWFCFKELLVHVKDSACAMYCVTHIAGHPLMKVWAAWSVGCYFLQLGYDYGGTEDTV